MPTRRAVLRSALAWSGISLLGDTADLFARLAAQPICPDAGPLGDLIGLVPFLGDRGGATPLGALVGGPGLDARLFTDLSDLQPDRLITPTPRVFVRTAAPAGVERKREDWEIAVHGLDRPVTLLRPRDFAKATSPMGAHLIECAGNSDPRNFGLMSVAEWDGVPLATILMPHVSPARDKGAWAVLVSGWDHDSQVSARSVPGASWIIPLHALAPNTAFLATQMNGEPLPLDHGAPVRLVVPGWYGCSWIKWVHEIRIVRADAPATSQMREFAARTHQTGVPDLARDYQPPVIDLAATPIRIEKRRVEGRLEYRIIGIVWGGERTTDRLTIRFSAGEAPQPFAICPAPQTHRTWSLWEYRWRPTEAKVYDIVIGVADPSIRARRLDLSFYIRRVAIDEA